MDCFSDIGLIIISIYLEKDEKKIYTIGNYRFQKDLLIDDKLDNIGIKSVKMVSSCSSPFRTLHSLNQLTLLLPLF